MTVAVIDTLKLVKRLRERMPQEDAEAFAEALNDSLGDKVATKSDIEASEARVTNKLYAVGFAVVLSLGILQHVLK